MLLVATFQWDSNRLKPHWLPNFSRLRYYHERHVGNAYKLIFHRNRANISHTIERNLLDKREKIKAIALMDA